MKLFRKKGKTQEEHTYDGMQPAVKSSICTGETVAGFVDAGGKFHEVMLVSGQEDLLSFCRTYRVEKEQLRHIF